jgi:hypothetical protein
MATITSTTVLGTRYSVAQDVTYLEQEFARARNSAVPPRVVIFIGEKHNEPADLARNKQLIANNGGGAAVTLAIERGMVNSAATRQVLEPVTGLDSPDPKRDELIVSRVVSYTDGLAAGEQNRPVVFVFGQEHEPRIKAEVVRQFPQNATIAWWSFPSVDDQVLALGPVRPVNAAAFTRVGWSAASLLNSQDQSLALRALERGTLPHNITVDVYDDTGFDQYIMKDRKIPIYTSDPVVLHAAQQALNADNYTTVTINNANTFRVTGLTRE